MRCQRLPSHRCHCCCREKVDKETFLKHLFESYNTLAEKNDEDSGKPAYFRFLTLLCFQIFLEKKVDVVILEVGLGGRLDATNCVEEPLVCGISPLGFDHMNVLGHTLPEIAKEKAGIMKPGIPAYTVAQRSDAMETLCHVAEEKETPLTCIPEFSEYSFVRDGQQLNATEIELGLSGKHQEQNASLAVVLAAAWEQRMVEKGLTHAQEAVKRSESVLRHRRIPKEYVLGLEKTQWPGRSQIVEDDAVCNHDANILKGDTNTVEEDTSNALTFFIDGAHTPESIVECAKWFAKKSKERESPASPAERVLLFNCMEERDPESLLQPLQSSLHRENVWPSEVIFSPTLSSYTKLSANLNEADLSWQQKLREAWEYSAPCLSYHQADLHKSRISSSLIDALHQLRAKSKQVKNRKFHVLVTGSLYLVGDVLKLLGKSV